MTKSVIVTGAAGAMGLEVLRLLAARDVNVACVDLDRARVTAQIDSLGGTTGEFLSLGADVSDDNDTEACVRDTVKTFGGLDGVFNIAGIEGEKLPVLDSTVEGFDRVIGVNVRSVFLSMKHAGPHLVARGGGTVVSTGSYGATRAIPTLGPYCASKHAVVGLTKTFALEMAESGIRANVVAPGAMDSPMIRQLFAAIADDPAEAEATMVADIPQRRLADPREAASVGVWLLLDAPAHITGQVIRVDGGLSAA